MVKPYFQHQQILSTRSDAFTVAPPAAVAYCEHVGFTARLVEMEVQMYARLKRNYSEVIDIGECMDMLMLVH